MLPDVHLAAAFWCLVSGIGIAILLYLYRDYRIDRLRDDIFALRDEMFDYAMSNGIVDDPAYRRVRQAFNGMLRFCHKISFFRLSMAIALDKIWKDRPKPTPVNQVIDESSLSREHKEKLKAYHIQMFILVILYISDTSFVLCPIIMVSKAKAVVGKFFHHAGQSLFSDFFKKTERGWQAIEEQALQTTQ